MSLARALQNQIATLLRAIWTTMGPDSAPQRSVSGSQSSFASSSSRTISRPSDASVTICDSCCETFRLHSNNIIGTNGGYLCEDCGGEQHSSRNRRSRTNNGAAAVFTSRQSRNRARPPASSSQAGHKQCRNTHAGDRNVESECDSGMGISDDQYYCSKQLPPSPSPPPLETVATAHTKQQTLFTSTNTREHPHIKTSSSPVSLNKTNTLQDIMTPSQTPPALPQDTAQKRKFPGTPEPTPTKKAKATLEAGFSTPRKISEVSSQATLLAAPFTPPTGGQRPIGLFGSQARNLARGNQKSLTFDENDLPNDQALRLYQRVDDMVQTIPSVVTEPLIHLTKRLDATMKENQKLKDDFKTLENHFEHSIQELTRKMNAALGLEDGPNFGTNGSQHGDGRDQAQAGSSPPN